MMCNFIVVKLKMGGTEEKEEGGWRGGSGAGATLGYTLSSSKESSGLTARGTDSWGGWVPTYGHIKETQIAGR
jgi:hypothetical protein